MVLALMTEECQATGEVFQTAGGTVGRSIWRASMGEHKMHSVEQCLANMDKLRERGKVVFEPVWLTNRQT